MIDQKNNTLVLLIDLCNSVYPDNIITNLKGEILFLGKSFLTSSPSNKSTHFSNFFLSDKTQNSTDFQELVKNKNITLSTKNEQKKAPTPENPPCTECGTQKGPYKLKPNHKEPEVISRLTKMAPADGPNGWKVPRLDR